MKIDREKNKIENILKTRFIADGLNTELQKHIFESTKNNVSKKLSVHSIKQ